jgi:hypothetical protein
VQHLPDRDFQLRILTTYPDHIPRPLCFIKMVRHTVSHIRQRFRRRKQFIKLMQFGQQQLLVRQSGLGILLQGRGKEND